MAIDTVEDALIAKVKAALTDSGQLRVKTVDSLPHDWEVDTLKRFLALAPAVLIAFSGGPVKTLGDDELASQWSLVVITGHASGQKARRRGDSQQIGAYEVIERIATDINGATIQGIGTPKLVAIENLSASDVEAQGLAVYALRFEIPMDLVYLAPDSALSAFVTFHTYYDSPPLDGEAEYVSWLAGDFSTSTPAAEDTVSLPQS